MLHSVGIREIVKRNESELVASYEKWGVVLFVCYEAIKNFYFFHFWRDWGSALMYIV
jgi:hypothetical protein